MIDDELRATLLETAQTSLDQAEKIWEGVADQLEKAAAFEVLVERAVLPSRIPGHPFVDADKPMVDDFIAFVFDIRDSTKHLLHRIASADVTQLQRVFYETSATLPVMERVLTHHGGHVTEYLGDGLLGFFRLPAEQRDDVVKASGTAARNAIQALQEIVSPLLTERYRLPALYGGVGLAVSQAIVTVVGSGYFGQPKAFGECVFRASKLANPEGYSGRDSIFVDKVLFEMWPSSKSGLLKFLPCKVRDVDGYQMTKTS